MEKMSFVTRFMIFLTLLSTFFLTLGPSKNFLRIMPVKFPSFMLREMPRRATLLSMSLIQMMNLGVVIRGRVILDFGR